MPEAIFAGIRPGKKRCGQKIPAVAVVSAISCAMIG
jgi:hypothetical protein